MGLRGTFSEGGIKNTISRNKYIVSKTQLKAEEVRKIQRNSPQIFIKKNYKVCKMNKNVFWSSDNTAEKCKYFNSRILF